MRKKLLCPCCHQRLMDGNPQTIAHTQVSTNIEDEQADYIIKCPKCKREISILKKLAVGLQ